MNATQEVLHVLESLEPKIKQIKDQFGLQMEEIRQLQDIE